MISKGSQPTHLSWGRVETLEGFREGFLAAKVSGQMLLRYSLTVILLKLLYKCCSGIPLHLYLIALYIKCCSGIPLHLYLMMAFDDELVLRLVMPLKTVFLKKLLVLCYGVISEAVS